MKFGRKILKSWREISRIERIEREKQNYKQKMWSKVNTWLTDLDGTSGIEQVNRTPSTLSTKVYDLADNENS